METRGGYTASRSRRGRILLTKANRTMYCHLYMELSMLQCRAMQSLARTVLQMYGYCASATRATIAHEPASLPTMPILAPHHGQECLLSPARQQLVVVGAFAREHLFAFVGQELSGALRCQGRRSSQEGCYLRGMSVWNEFQHLGKEAYG